MDNEMIVELGRCNYKIYESKDLFCFGIDSVLLAWFAKQKKKDKVIDLGTGTGVIPILMKARYDGDSYLGIDIIEESVLMARRSVTLNNLDKCITIEHSDLKEYHKKSKAKFDIVTSNPPYMIVSDNSKNEKITCKNKNQSLEIARHEICCTIEDVVKEASKLLNSKGKFYIVYKPDRLVSLISFMRKYKIEPKRIQFVSAYKDSNPNIVLVEGIKDGNESLTVENNLVVYEKEGKYTREILDIYEK